MSTVSQQTSAKRSVAMLAKLSVIAVAIAVTLAGLTAASADPVDLRGTNCPNCTPKPLR
jgi:hypothetical protein